jgi:hypothetical protein
VHEKLTQVDQLIGEASAVRQLLLDTLDRKCPKLVERGRAIGRATTSTRTAINWPNRPARRSAFWAITYCRISLILLCRQALRGNQKTAQV